ncbi:MAG TPA: RdgB/HAM1 family non-canonical purine NTP pyrophosphatase [Polyangiaceae bacterium]|nr:RdgB/HAM1 family non-canonical purine NTP pyrophosphatase [Polyangiaceae bacterium]
MRAHGSRDTLVVATGNRGKLEELRALLAGLPLRVLGVSEVLRDPPRVVEDGATFVENAVKKAREVARATLMWTLADDSGLEVDALGGRPGVRSARFAHERATDAENNAALLAELGALSDPVSGELPGELAGEDGFRARFRCVLALVDPFTGNGEPRTVEGVCEGTVTRAPRGSGGFGYDPLFVVAGTDRTMAELSEQEKNRLSHRAKAFMALQPVLTSILEARAAQVSRLG